MSESVTHSTVTLAGKRFNVSRDARGQCYVGDETSEAFIERMALLGRSDIIDDLTAMGKAKLKKSLLCGSAQMTAWALHQNRTKNN